MHYPHTGWHFMYRHLWSLTWPMDCYGIFSKTSWMFHAWWSMNFKKWWQSGLHWKLEKKFMISERKCVSIQKIHYTQLCKLPINYSLEKILIFPQKRNTGENKLQMVIFSSAGKVFLPKYSSLLPNIESNQNHTCQNFLKLKLKKQIPAIPLKSLIIMNISWYVPSDSRIWHKNAAFNWFRDIFSRKGPIFVLSSALNLPDAVNIAYAIFENHGSFIWF